MPEPGYKRDGQDFYLIPHANLFGFIACYYLIIVVQKKQFCRTGYRFTLAIPISDYSVTLRMIQDRAQRRPLVL